MLEHDWTEKQDQYLAFNYSATNHACSTASHHRPFGGAGLMGTAKAVGKATRLARNPLPQK
jgi:hypothetical protein